MSGHSKERLDVLQLQWKPRYASARSLSMHCDGWFVIDCTNVCFAWLGTFAGYVARSYIKH